MLARALMEWQWAEIEAYDGYNRLAMMRKWNLAAGPSPPTPSLSLRWRMSVLPLVPPPSALRPPLRYLFGAALSTPTDWCSCVSFLLRSCRTKCARSRMLEFGACWRYLQHPDAHEACHITLPAARLSSLRTLASKALPSKAPWRPA